MENSELDNGNTNDVSSKDLFMVFGAIAFGLFITGNILFNIANYQSIKKIREKTEGI